MDEFTLRSTVELPPVSAETIPEYLIEKAREHAENGKTAWIIDTVTGETHHFKDFEEETRKVASFFYKHGMRKGDTAIFMTYDLVKLHLFATGVWRANGHVRSSYPEDDEQTLLGRVEESRVGWIICEPEAVDMCKSVADKVYWDVEIIVNGEADDCIPYSEMLQDDGSECPELQLSGDDPAVILCTSGTTGNSKGAVHTQKSFLQTIHTMALYTPFTTDKPNLLLSKGTHITGTLFPVSGLVNGVTVLVMPTIKKQNVFEAVHNYQPGFIFGFPTFLLMLVNDPDASNYDFSSLEAAATGGVQITPAVEKSLSQLPNLKAVFNMYGLTEIVPVCTEIDYANEDRLKYEDAPPFSVGKVAPGAGLQIRHPESGQALGPNERGEICIKSDNCFASYLNNPEATENAFIEGFFRTGDLGYFNEDGFVFLVDRMKEIFKYFNNHISPTELEDIINRHEAVAEVCVIGIEDPEGGGSIPRAFVTLKIGDDVQSEDILNFANEKLPDYKKIRGGLFVVPELPKGKTGKIVRNLVAQIPLPE